MMKEKIENKILSFFSPDLLKVLNQSEAHKGHIGSDESGETHFKVIIVSDAFEGLEKIARHRLVYEILGKEIISKIHALSITASTLNEYKINSVNEL